jgi:hypothetical protein
MKTHPVTSQPFHAGEPNDTHGEANTRCAQFCKTRLNHIRVPACCRCAAVLISVKILHVCRITRSWQILIAQVELRVYSQRRVALNSGRLIRRSTRDTCGTAGAQRNTW